jgi:hypothetical protein
MSILAVFQKFVSVLLGSRYRPELHYMRGPGPKWYERQALRASRRIG